MFDALGNFYPDYPGQIDPRFARQAPLPQSRPWQPQPPAAPTMTPPTIHAEIIQVGSIEQASKHPVAAGCSQMFITADEQAVIVKTVNPSADGYTVEIYDKRPPAPPAPVFDPRQYLTRQETAALIDERLRGLQPILAAPAPVPVATAPVSVPAPALTPSPETPEPVPAATPRRVPARTVSK